MSTLVQSELVKENIQTNLDENILYFGCICFSSLEIEVNDIHEKF